MLPSMLAVKHLSFLFLLGISGGMSGGITGCVSQPPDQPPTALPPEHATDLESDLIPYRTLVVDDFKATKSPGQKTPDMEGDVGAASVVIIRTTPCTVRAFARSHADSSFFEALVDSFRYEARFDRAHSWFDPAHASVSALLEHEQIHFAIAEIAARRANADIDEIRGRIRASARDRAAAVRLAQQRFEDELDRVKKEAAERQVQFDRETENGTHLGESKSWSVRIRRELAGS